jgi:hypothetical protein
MAALIDRREEAWQKTNGKKQKKVAKRGRDLQQPPHSVDSCPRAEVLARTDVQLSGHSSRWFALLSASAPTYHS